MTDYVTYWHNFKKQKNINKFSPQHHVMIYICLCFLIWTRGCVCVRMCVSLCVNPASLKISLGCEIPVSAQGLCILICLGKLLH